MKSIKLFFYQVVGLSKILGYQNFLKIIVCVIYWKFVTKKEFIFNFKFENKKFKIFANNRMDLVGMYEVFVLKEYDFLYIENLNVILDLGANIGDTSLFYALKFPESQIFAVEPNTNILPKLLKNTNQFKNIKVINCAISNKTEIVKLNFGDSHLGSSLLHRDENNNSIDIQGYSLQDFCKENKINKIDLLKFDIEGAEERLLENESFIKQNVISLVGEIHDDLTSIPMFEKIEGLNLKNTSKKILSKSRYIIYGEL